MATTTKTIRVPKQTKAKKTKPVEINTDLEACEILKKLCEHTIIRTGEGWYVKMPQYHCWSIGDEYVKQIIMDTNFIRNKLPYSANVKGCNNIFNCLQNCITLFPIQEKFIEEINENTKGKVFFNDKYYDLEKRLWVENKGSKIIPLIYIDRLAPDFSKITPEDVVELKEKLLNMFDTDITLNTMLKALSRAIGGYTNDKVWYVLLGLRDSGKGMLQEIIIQAFADYVTITDPPMCRSYNSGDASENRWLISTKSHYKRIALTNEIKGIEGKQLTLDGNIIKKVIASGGDFILARAHYKAEIRIKNNTTTFMSLNELPQTEPADALSTMRLFTMPFKYVPEEEKDKDKIYKLANNNLKSEIRSKKNWWDVFTYMVFNAFDSTPVSVAELSGKSKEEYTDIIAEKTTNPVEILLKYFKSDADGFVHSKTIFQLFSPMKWSDKKIAQFLKERGYKKDRKTIDTKSYNIYTGLSLLPSDTEEKEEANVVTPL